MFLVLYLPTLHLPAASPRSPVHPSKAIWLLPPLSAPTIYSLNYSLSRYKKSRRGPQYVCHVNKQFRHTDFSTFFGPYKGVFPKNKLSKSPLRPFFMVQTEFTFSFDRISYLTVTEVMCGLTPSYQYRKPSMSTVSPTFRASTAL